MEVDIFDIKSEFLHFVFAIKFSNLTIDLFNFVFEKKHRNFIHNRKIS